MQSLTGRCCQNSAAVRRVTDSPSREVIVVHRVEAAGRANWQTTVEEQGFIFHSLDVPYWYEDAHYTFSTHDIDLVEVATLELHARCLDAVDFVIARRRYSDFGIPERAVPLIEASWKEGAPTLYGRFDLAFDGTRQPIMLEYNADTPTSLLEAAVIQWGWLKDMHDSSDQFNSIHEKLIARWKAITPRLHGKNLYFACADSVEDTMTTAYVRACAAQAGLGSKLLSMSDIVYDHRKKQFVDPDHVPIRNMFKLYPWEWMIHERFGAYLGAGASSTSWIEPAWKMILSNKAILAVLWELFPKHPNLVASFLGSAHQLRNYAKKPLLSREGANVTLVRAGHETVSGLDRGYGEEGFVYQEMVSIKTFGGMTPVVGSWIVGDEAAGIGIREAVGAITDNLSRFVPHLIDG
jgi:glutathionylspermidine synthase